MHESLVVKGKIKTAPLSRHGHMLDKFLCFVSCDFLISKSPKHQMSNIPLTPNQSISSIHNQYSIHLSLNRSPLLFRSSSSSSPSSSSSRRLVLQRRQIKRLAPPSIAPRPRHGPRPRTPPQRPNPRLHIPPHVQRHVTPLRHPARDVPDLILGSLVAETQVAVARGLFLGGGGGFVGAFLVGGAACAR